MIRNIPLSLLFLFTIWIQNVSASTYYVSNSGNNSNNGTTPSTAWLTLQHAANQVEAGDSVLVANGTYVGFDLRTSGTASQPIVFMANGNSVLIDTRNPVTPDNINMENADYIEINGFRVIDSPRNGIRLVFANNCIVRNTYCDNNFERGIFTGFTNDILIEHNECLNSIDEHGIYVSNSSDRSIIRYNVCHHNNRGGIQINADASQGGDGISSNPQIYGNILYENGLAGGAAINLDGVQGAFIYNNLLYENHASGIALFMQDGGGPSINATIVHNTILQANNGRWCILIVNGATGAKVYNNILINQHPWRGSIALDPDCVAGFESDYNILVNSLSNEGDGVSMTLEEWQEEGYDLHSALTPAIDEVFEDAANNDYHLLATTTVIDAGSGENAFGVNTDIEGNLRPQYVEHDPGAYESPQTLDVHDDEENDKPVVPAGLVITSDKVQWSADDFATLKFYSFSGQEVLSMRLESDGEINISQWSPGMYLIIKQKLQQVIWTVPFSVIRK